MEWLGLWNRRRRRVRRRDNNGIVCCDTFLFRLKHLFGLMAGFYLVSFCNSPFFWASPFSGFPRCFSSLIQHSYRELMRRGVGIFFHKIKWNCY